MTRYTSLSPQILYSVRYIIYAVTLNVLFAGLQLRDSYVNKYVPSNTGMPKLRYTGILCSLLPWHWVSELSSTLRACKRVHSKERCYNATQDGSYHCSQYIWEFVALCSGNTMNCVVTLTFPPEVELVRASEVRPLH